MKILFTVLIIFALAVPQTSRADTNDIATYVQRGLFEEEANHQYEAAIANYKSALDRYDHERHLAATAIFRLGECYRKQGRTNEANVQFERLVREFPEQTQLTLLSQSYLPANAVPPTGAQQSAAMTLLTDEQKFLIEVKRAVQNSPDLINDQFATAVSQGYLSAADYLLDHGADVNPVPGSVFVPIIKAANLGNDAMVQLLLRRGAKVDWQAGGGYTAFSGAAMHHFTKVCLTLISNHADVNLGSISPLAYAVEYGDEAMVRLLLNNGADTETRGLSSGKSPGENGETTLGIATGSKSLSICKLLVEHHANVNARDKTGSTPIYNSIVQNDFSTVEYLVSNRADLNVSNNNGETPFLCAMAHASNNIIRLLLESGSDINAKDKSGLSAIYKAIEKNDFPLTQYLITNQILLNVTNNAGETPLLWAMACASNNVIKLLLDNKANPSQLTTALGYFTLPPLDWAISAGRLDVISLLADAGADINAPLPATSTFGKGSIPTRVNAASRGMPFQPQVYPQSGSTPLYWTLHSSACRSAEQTEKIAAILLAHGASPNVINPEDKWTPLTGGVQLDDASLVELLINHGADVNQTNGFGKAPLACLRTPRTPATEKIESALIAAGADANLNRRTFIWTASVGRTRTTQIFRCEANSINHYTLLETIAELYRVEPVAGSSVMGVRHSGQFRYGKYAHPSSLIDFPDFEHVIIHRLNQPPNETLSRNVAEILASGDRKKDLLLQSGDIVEIGNHEHRVAEEWHGLPNSDLAALNALLARKVRVSTRSRTNTYVLTPPLELERNRSQNPDGLLFPVPSAHDGQDAEIPVVALRLDKVIRDENVLLNTWDLSKVRLIRDGKAHTFDLTATPVPEVWLEDGDLIDISDSADADVTAPSQSSLRPQPPSQRGAPPGHPPAESPAR